jgi:uncharacterized protein with von Willebrand factor type A (vWA) domain
MSASNTPDTPGPESADEGGRLATNIMYFGRALRAAGLPIGPGHTLRAIQAIETIGVGDRKDFYWALHAVFVNRRDQREIFDQAFHIFWRNPKILERMMSLVLPGLRGDESPDQEEISPRVAEGLRGGARDQEPERQIEKEETKFDAAMSWSKNEVLRDKDFDKMTTEEMTQARRALQTMRLPIPDLKTRRFFPNPRGARADLRATMRSVMRTGGDVVSLKTKSRRKRRPPLIILCDISGSMDRYARMMLHFMHAITNDRDRVHTFLFGTRLTNVTRYLRQKDVDIALDSVADAVEDWSGGTRIGACLHDFNQNWSRRVLGQGAMVLFISDGLDREAGEGVSSEMDRLHRSCRRLIWLNPLLRYDMFEPKSLGVRALMPFVDDFKPVHNLNSLTQLVAVLGDEGPRTSSAMSQWRERAA